MMLAVFVAICVLCSIKPAGVKRLFGKVPVVKMTVREVFLAMDCGEWGC